MADLTRRTFLQASAAGAASAASKLSVAQAKDDDIPFAIVGCGAEGQRITKYMATVPGARLVAICDINPLNIPETKKFGPDAKVYEDWKEMLATERDLRAVLIALPEHTHAPAAMDAMNAGKDVFCEKPMAYSVDLCRQMLATRDKTQRVLQIGQQRRSNPLYYLAERLIQKEGLIGQVIRADAYWDRWTDWKRPVPKIDKDFSPWGFPTANHLVNWRLYRDYSHGLMTENGTHQLDACGWLSGERKPQYVCGMATARYDDDRETPDVVSAEYMFDGDVVVRFTQDFHQGFNYRGHYGELILGDEGTLRLGHQHELIVYDKRGKEQKVSIERLGNIELAGVPVMQQELVEREKLPLGLMWFSYENEMRIFANCVRTRVAPTCTGEIGLNSAAMTIIGTEAQAAKEFRHFRAADFA